MLRDQLEGGSAAGTFARALGGSLASPATAPFEIGRRASQSALDGDLQGAADAVQDAGIFFGGEAIGASRTAGRARTGLQDYLNDANFGESRGRGFGHAVMSEVGKLSVSDKRFESIKNSPADARGSSLLSDPIAFLSDLAQSPFRAAGNLGSGPTPGAARASKGIVYSGEGAIAAGAAAAADDLATDEE